MCIAKYHDQFEIFDLGHRSKVHPLFNAKSGVPNNSDRLCSMPGEMGILDKLL